MHSGLLRDALDKIEGEIALAEREGRKIAPVVIMGAVIEARAAASPVDDAAVSGGGEAVAAWYWEVKIGAELWERHLSFAEPFDGSLIRNKTPLYAAPHPVTRTEGEDGSIRFLRQAGEQQARLSAPPTPDDGLVRALEDVATQFDIKASMYTPGLQANLRNPYAGRIRDEFMGAAKQIRAAIAASSTSARGAE